MNENINADAVFPVKDRAQVRKERLVFLGRVAGVLFCIAVLVAVFYLRTYSGLHSVEAMDTAQIARNINDGSGFTTRALRPFTTVLTAGRTGNPYVEVLQAPLYPYFVAGFFKARTFSDEVVIWASMASLLLCVVSVYLLGRVLFEWKTGLLSAVIFASSLPVLKIGVSGEKWPFVAFLFTLLLLFVALYHKAQETGTKRKSIVYSLLCGVVLAVLFHASYATFILAIPLLVYFAITGPYRKYAPFVFILSFIVLSGYRMYLNQTYTGCPILAASAWSVFHNTPTYPGDSFYRSTQGVDVSIGELFWYAFNHFGDFSYKLTTQTTKFAYDLAAMLGLFALPFAVVSVLYKFKQSAACAVRSILYVCAPVIVITYALLSQSADSLIMLAAPAAVFAANYFLLLVGAKKLHPFYTQAIVAGLIVLTALPAVFAILIPGAYKKEASEAEKYFAQVGAQGVRGLVYTDSPVVAAWRSNFVAVWLPKSDEDVWEMSSVQLPMRAIILTPESEKLEEDEAWYMLYTVPLFRKYVEDPEAGYDAIIDALDMESAPDDEVAKRNLDRIKRQYAVSQTVSGFFERENNPLSPDNVLVLIAPEYQ